MLNLNAMNVIADNEVAINGVVIGKLTDDDAQKLISIVKGFMSNTSTGSVSKPAVKVSKPSKVKKLKVAYHITLWNNLYCISRGDENGKHGGWTRGEKSTINAAIKALPEIVTTRVRLDGVKEFNAWGYADEKTAIDMMATLPREFEVEA